MIQLPRIIINASPLFQYVHLSVCASDISLIVGLIIIGLDWRAEAICFNCHLTRHALTDMYDKRKEATLRLPCDLSKTFMTM
jgi:hypothetical protein